MYTFPLLIVHAIHSTLVCKRSLGGLSPIYDDHVAATPTLALPGGTCDGWGPCQAPWRDEPEYWSESLPPWKRGLPMGRYEVSVLKCCFVPLVRQWDGYLGPALRAGSLGVAPRRSASHLAAAGPRGPRLARRRASRPRWSRTPGGRGDAGHVTSAPRFIRRRDGCSHCAVTVPGRWGDAPQLCGPGPRQGT
jgi:hypothetical protein